MTVRFVGVAALFLALPFVSATEIVQVPRETSAEGTLMCLKLSPNEFLEYQSAVSKKTVKFADGGKYEGQLLYNLVFTDNIEANHYRTLTQFTVRDASFKKTLVQYSDLNRIFFQNSSFDGADLDGTRLAVDAACTFESARCENTTIFGMTGQQWKQTENYRNKSIYEMTFYVSDMQNISFRQFAFYSTAFAFHHVEKNFPGLYNAYKPPVNTFKRCDFSETKLDGVRFEHCRFEDCPFTKAEIKNSEFISHTGFDRCDFTGAEICHSEFWNLSRPQLESTASYQSGNLFGLKFCRCDLRGISFAGKNLTGCSFTDDDGGYCVSDLTGADFNDAVVSGCTFTDKFTAKGLTADQIRSTWNYKNKRMNTVKLPPEIEKELNSTK